MYTNCLLFDFPESDLVTSSVLQCGIKIVFFENKHGRGNNEHFFPTCSTMRPTENALSTGIVSNCKPHFKNLLFSQDAVQKKQIGYCENESTISEKSKVLFQFLYESILGTLQANTNSGFVCESCWKQSCTGNISVASSWIIFKANTGGRFCHHFNLLN